MYLVFVVLFAVSGVLGRVDDKPKTDSSTTTASTTTTSEKTGSSVTTTSKGPASTEKGFIEKAKEDLEKTVDNLNEKAMQTLDTIRKKIDELDDEGQGKPGKLEKTRVKLVSIKDGAVDKLHRVSSKVGQIIHKEKSTTSTTSTTAKEKSTTSSTTTTGTSTST